MGNLTVLALRIVLAVSLVGTLFVQVVMVPLISIDLEEFGRGLADARAPIVVILVLGIVTIQVVLVCVWRLLTMVRRATVFSHAAFRYVHIVIGATASASLLLLALAFTLAIQNRTHHYDVVAPGMVALVCGGALLIAGVALIVLVLRMLLAQAVARDAEAQHLQAELDEVI
jgi:phosphoglycerol transferase MdoB-like AlkP superfamily enzyme